jgi:hypothetical protein
VRIIKVSIRLDAIEESRFIASLHSQCVVCALNASALSIILFSASVAASLEFCAADPR